MSFGFLLIYLTLLCIIILHPFVPTKISTKRRIPDTNIKSF